MCWVRLWWCSQRRDVDPCPLSGWPVLVGSRVHHKAWYSLLNLAITLWWKTKDCEQPLSVLEFRSEVNHLQEVRAYLTVAANLPFCGFTPATWVHVFFLFLSPLACLRICRWHKVPRIHFQMLRCCSTSKTVRSPAGVPGVKALQVACLLYPLSPQPALSTFAWVSNIHYFPEWLSNACNKRLFLHPL